MSTDRSSTESRAFLGLSGRVAIVTGAGSGIGRAIAMAFGEAGAAVAVLDRNLDGATRTVEALIADGARACAIACDVGNAAEVEAAAERSATELGACDILVNNAGAIRPGPLETLSLDDWNGTLGSMLGGCFICSQTFSRQMRARHRGAIVHIASISASQPTAQAGAYSVAKAGIAMLSAQLAIEWGKDGIRSNVVNPGMTLTPMTQARYEQPGNTERLSRAVPLGRLGRPEDIAEAVVFLASDRSAYINGQEITVDGGFTRMLMSLMPRGEY